MKHPVRTYRSAFTKALGAESPGVGSALHARILAILVLAAFAAIFTVPAAAADGDPADGYDAVWKVTSLDPDVRARAIAELRNDGRRGLERLLEAHAEHWPRLQTASLELTDLPFLRLLGDAIDKVAGQKHADVSRLFWFTDFERACAAARAEGKPVLSLRLLGRLDEELSCANSRFFRTILYPNSAIATRLREDWILHWESVRPAPRITIDFGDGRRIERTITGNSIHYVLDADGNVLDALPGLYAPDVFLERLDEARGTHARLVSLSQPERAELLPRFHRAAAGALEDRYRKDLAVAIPCAEELPGADASLETWEALGRLRPERSRIDGVSRGLIGRLHPTADEAMKRTVTKRFVEDPMLEIVRGLERSVAADTARNDYVLRRTILEWLAEGDASTKDVTALNDRVYAELFKTPHDDPWMGLDSKDVFTGLRGRGLVLE